MPAKGFRKSNRIATNGDGTATIYASNGGEILIDESDIDLVRGYFWFAWKGQRKTRYAKTNVENKLVSMHTLIMYGETEPRGRIVDHINHNGLDNRRSNLRVASSSQNSCNRLLRVDNKTGYKGVSRKRNGIFVSDIQAGPERKRIGAFSSAIEAAVAYDLEAIRLHREFAVLNFPKENYL